MNLSLTRLLKVWPTFDSAVIVDSTAKKSITAVTRTIYYDEISSEIMRSLPGDGVFLSRIPDQTLRCKTALQAHL